MRKALAASSGIGYAAIRCLPSVEGFLEESTQSASEPSCTRAVCKTPPSALAGVSSRASSMLGGAVAGSRASLALSRDAPHRKSRRWSLANFWKSPPPMVAVGDRWGPMDTNNGAQTTPEPQSLSREATTPLGTAGELRRSRRWSISSLFKSRQTTAAVGDGDNWNPERSRCDLTAQSKAFTESCPSFAVGCDTVPRKTRRWSFSSLFRSRPTMAPAEGGSEHVNSSAAGETSLAGGHNGSTKWWEPRAHEVIADIILEQELVFEELQRKEPRIRLDTKRELVGDAYLRSGIQQHRTICIRILRQLKSVNQEVDKYWSSAIGRHIVSMDFYRTCIVPRQEKCNRAERRLADCLDYNVQTLRPSHLVLDSTQGKAAKKFCKSGQTANELYSCMKYYKVLPDDRLQRMVALRNALILLIPELQLADQRWREWTAKEPKEASLNTRLRCNSTRL